MAKKPTNAELTAELARVKEQARVDIETLRAQWGHADQDKHRVLAEANKTIAALETEVNQLRDKLFAAYLDAERFRGYLDGQADMQPPRMVPEERELRGPYRNREWNADTMPQQPRYSAGSPSPRAWYHRAT